MLQEAHPGLHVHPCVSSSSNHSFTPADGGGPGVPSTPQSLGSSRNSPLQLSWAAAQCGNLQGLHLQGGELAHIGEGGVAQGADLVVAQIAGKEKPQSMEPAGPCPPSLLPCLLSCNGVRTAARHSLQGSSRAITQADGSNATVPTLPHVQRQQRLSAPRGCASLPASCVPVQRVDAEECWGSLRTARPLLRIMHHGDSLCPRPKVPAVGLAAWAPAPGYLHKLQILEGGELPRDLSELVSIQVAARDNKSTLGWLRSRRSLPLPSHFSCALPQTWGCEEHL